MKLGKLKDKNISDVIHEMKWNELWDDVGYKVSSSVFDSIDEDLWIKNNNEPELTFFSLLPKFDETELRNFLDENRK